ncbi:MAG: nucleotidyltransferase domain-containing protein, partial [Deltaproteobacteria bacterium]|nr:nucleotidyltransferase domain-containing protein [Deltaproteobacteria bacterium]
QLKGLGVSTLYLFGSRAQGIHHRGSDYDFGILMDGSARGKKGDLYLALYDVLADVVDEPVNLDIVFLESAPVQLQYHVVQYGKVLLDRDPVRRGRFVQRVLEAHADFEPYRRLFASTTLARIP